MIKHRISFALVLTIFLALSSPLAPAVLANTYTYGDWEYEDNGATITITGYTGTATSVTIPSTINGKPVTVIGEYVFFEYTALESATIPYGVETIGYLAFRGCSNLLSIEIPNSVTEIGDRAFSDCDSLTIINIPESVTLLGPYFPFSDCASLTDIHVSPNNPEYSSIDGVLYNKAQTALILYPMARTGSHFDIPYSVTSIAREAFRSCDSLTNITIPNSVTYIGDVAFGGCSKLSSITIPNSIRHIGQVAFAGCASLFDVFFESETPPGVDYAQDEDSTPPFPGVAPGARAIVPYGTTAYGPVGSLWNGLIVTYGSPPISVSPTSSTVYVNGIATAFEAYFINGNNYFKLRDLALAVSGTGKQFSVRYNDETRAITLTSGEPYTRVGGEMSLGDGSAKSAVLNRDIDISIDGVPVEITAYMISGNNFVKLRDVMRLFDIGVTYDETTRDIGIVTSMPYVE